MARALDIGTMFLVKGEVDEIANGTVFTSERNCFLLANTSSDTEEVLKENNWNFAKYNNEYYLLGEDAIKLKNLLTVKTDGNNVNMVVTKVGDLRRPMKDGILNTNEEKLSVAIIQKLIANLLGPAKNNEHLVFCAPGDPLDKSFSVLFHKTMLTNFLKSLGYTVECIPEALAIIFSERPVAEDPSEENNEAPFSGIGISCGAGMLNCCLKGDTKISLLNGSSISIEELSKTHAEEYFWVYSCDSNGQIVPGRAHSPRLTRKNSKVVKVTLDNGEYFECTDDHKIMLRDGSYKEAGSLNINDSLMPLYRDTYSYPNSSSKYEMVKNNKTGRWNKTHRLVATQISGNQIRRGYVIHHKDFNSRNNSPENLEIMSNSEHSKLHKILSEYSKKMFKGKTIEEIFGDRADTIRDKRAEGIRRALQDEDTKNRMIAGLVRFNNSRKGKTIEESYGEEIASSMRQSMSIAKSGKTKAEILKSSEKSEAWAKKMSELGKGKFGKYNRTDEIRKKTSESLKGNTPWNKGMSGEEYKSKFKNGFKNQYNHKVVKVEVSNEVCDVYDLTVEKYHNFAISSGVFVHNCFTWKKLPLINFSVARSGDFIDTQSAATAGIDVSAMTKYKEKHLDLDNVDYSDMRQAALDIYYQNVIEHALTKFAEKFNQLDNQIDSPLEIVLAGGTASVKGFLGKFQRVLEGIKLPFKVKGVRMAENPLYAVANGCLIKAISNETKAKNSENVSKDKEAKEPTEEPTKKIKIKN